MSDDPGVFKTTFTSSSTGSHYESEALTQSLQTIINSFKEHTTELLGLVAYSGFDVLKFRATLVNEKHVTNEELVFCVMIFMVRGNNVVRILESTKDEEVKNLLTSLRRKLDIKNSAAGKTTHVTLSRIAIAFPEITALLLDAAPEMPGAIPLEYIRKLTGYPEYPAVARQSSLACFLPQRMPDSEAMLAVFFLPNLMFSETINRGKKDWKALNENEKAETTHVYQLNAWNSTLFSEEERITWSIKLGILVSSSRSHPEFTSVWKEARKVSERILLDKHSFSFTRV